MRVDYATFAVNIAQCFYAKYLASIYTGGKKGKHYR